MAFPLPDVGPSTGHGSHPHRPGHTSCPLLRAVHTRLACTTSQGPAGHLLWTLVHIRCPLRLVRPPGAPLPIKPACLAYLSAPEPSWPLPGDAGTDQSLLPWGESRPRGSETHPGHTECDGAAGVRQGMSSGGWGGAGRTHRIHQCELLCHQVGREHQNLRLLPAQSILCGHWWRRPGLLKGWPRPRDRLQLESLRQSGLQLCDGHCCRLELGQWLLLQGRGWSCLWLGR